MRDWVERSRYAKILLKIYLKKYIYIGFLRVTGPFRLSKRCGSRKKVENIKKIVDNKGTKLQEDNKPI